MLKYLYGKLPVAGVLNGGREDKLGRATALLFSVRRDSYQHAEMAFDTCFVPFNGGFANLDPVLKTTEFYGESVSCRVETDPEEIHKLIYLKKEGKVFYTTGNERSQKVFAILPLTAGYPLKTGRTGDWVPCTLEEMKELCNTERSLGVTKSR